MPSRSARAAVAALQARVAQRLPGAVRRVRPSAYHVTLVFLGAVPETALLALRAVADSLAMPRCRLELDRLGQFTPARVGWLGCTTLPAGLAAFRARLAASLAAAGHAADARPWVPHLTLYRDLRTRLPRVDFEPVGWRCERFELLRTEAGRDGPVYRPVGRWKAVSRGGEPG